MGFGFVGLQASTQILACSSKLALLFLARHVRMMDLLACVRLFVQEVQTCSPHDAAFRKIRAVRTGRVVERPETSLQASAGLPEADQSAATGFSLANIGSMFRACAVLGLRIHAQSARLTVAACCG